MPVFDVGPLHKLSPAASDSNLLLPDQSCLEGLDAWPPESVLYVSFGSLACMSPRDLVGGDLERGAASRRRSAGS